jgi:hypothetical protein
MRREETEERCAGCRHFDNRSASVEGAFPGLSSLSSAYGSVWAEAGVCGLHDLLVSPWRTCKDFAAPGRGSRSALPGAR